MNHKFRHDLISVLTRHKSHGTLSSIPPQWFSTGEMVNEGRPHPEGFSLNTSITWKFLKDIPLFPLSYGLDSFTEMERGVGWGGGSNESQDAWIPLFLKCLHIFFLACLLFTLP